MIDGQVRVGIVAPVHNRREITLRCLRSLARIDRNGLDVRIVIVDDGSNDGTGEAIERDFPKVELIKADGSLWFTEGTNVGIRAALKHDPDFILMMNDDQVFDAGFLRSMVETAVKYPRSVVGSLLLLWDMPHKLFQVAPQWKTLLGGWRHWHRQTVWTIPASPWEVELIVGNCVLVPVAAIEECGLMNSERYPNFGDAEYTPRLRKNGWRLLIEPRARVFIQPNDVLVRVSKMPLRRKIDGLIWDLKNIQNLRRRFYCYWDSAPTKWAAVAAFALFFLRLALGKNVEGSWAQQQMEAPLAETFSDALCKE